MDIDKPSVAIYWDFENIHASLIDQLKGTGTYRQTRFTPQDPVVNVAALMEFCASFGSIAINRAYGNWQWFARYREALLQMAGVSLERGNGLQARAFLERYLASGAAAPDVLMLGVQIERTMGDAAAAADYGAQIKSQFPDSPEARVVDEVLRQERR